MFSSKVCIKGLSVLQDDLKKALLASLQDLNPATSWVKDPSGRHTNLAAVLDWPDSEDSDTEAPPPVTPPPPDGENAEAEELPPPPAICECRVGREGQTQLCHYGWCWLFCCL